MATSLKIILIPVFLSISMMCTGCILGERDPMPIVDGDENDDNDDDNDNNDDNDDNDDDNNDNDESGSDADTDGDSDSDQDSNDDSCPAMSSETDAPRVTESNHGDDWNLPKCLTAGCHDCEDPSSTVGADCGYCHGGNGAEDIQCKQGHTSGCGSCHTTPLHGTSGVIESGQLAECDWCHAKW